MTLPTFKPDAACAQCGHDEVSTRFMESNEVSCQSTYAPPAYDGARCVCHYHRGPHFHRKCGRCGWSWAEAVQSPSLDRTKCSLASSRGGSR